VLHLVDCSLLVSPRPGPDGRSRYVMLETLRAYGNRLLAEAGEQDQAAAALAGHALAIAEQAAAGIENIAGEQDAARWLDAEDATMRQVLAWALDRDTTMALRLAVALAPWWMPRGRLGDMYPALRAAAGRAEPGSDGWCTAQFWLGWAATFSGDPAGALAHFTALRDAVAGRPASPVLSDGLTGGRERPRPAGGGARGGHPQRCGRHYRDRVERSDLRIRHRQGRHRPVARHRPAGHPPGPPDLAGWVLAATRARTTHAAQIVRARPHQRSNWCGCCQARCSGGHASTDRHDDGRRSSPAHGPE
jgi:hypothetical protein